MRILLIGNSGQLGWELERCLLPFAELLAIDYPAIDLADVHATRQAIHHFNPVMVINAAAYTAVDRAETEPDIANSINAIAPGVIAEEAENIGAAFIHFSTDYVFDGLQGTPYVETDAPRPLNVYGRTKLAGEQRVQQIGGAYLILRTSWVYSMRRDSFVNKVLNWARSQSTLKLVTDQISAPTWARMLAQVTSHLVLLGGEAIVDWVRHHHGLYHLAGSGYCSRFEWGQEILRLDPYKEEQVITTLLPALTHEFPTPASRPQFSALNCDLFMQTFHLQLPDWKYALKLALEAQ
jgi:dTDP-4-dehydrorhamnose reductase